MEQTRQLAKQWIEVWGRDDPATLPLADDFVHVSPFGTIEGRENYLEFIRPKTEGKVGPIPVQDIFADGDRACVRYMMALPGGPLDCCDVVTVDGGNIASVHAYYDTRDMPGFEKY